MARAPWSVPTVSDASKLGLCGKWEVGSFNSAGSRLYKLLFQLTLQEDFANLTTNWTEVDAGANVNLAGGVVSINGNGSDNQNGLIRKTGFSRAKGYIEYKTIGLGGSTVHFCGPTSSASLTVTAAALYVNEVAVSGNRQIRHRSTADSGLVALTAGQWYTLRFYLDTDASGNWLVYRVTIYHVTEFPAETVVTLRLDNAEWPATIYTQFNRRTNDAGNPIQIKEYREYFGYPADGPYLTCVADAGKLFAVSAAGTLDATDLEDPEASVTGAVSFTGGATGILRSYNATTGKANIHSISGMPQAGTATCTATGHTFTISDTGVQGLFRGFDFTRFKAVGSWATTNAKFRYAVDGGAASAWKTLAELRAVGKLAGPYRVVFDAQANSDGATQQYLGEVNSPDATEGIGDFPARTSVIEADTVQGASGTYHEATVAEVQKSVAFGPASAYEGTYIKPSYVRAGGAAVGTTLITQAIAGQAVNLSQWTITADTDINGVNVHAYLYKIVAGTPTPVADLGGVAVNFTAAVPVNLATALSDPEIDVDTYGVGQFVVVVTVTDSISGTRYQFSGYDVPDFPEVSNVLPPDTVNGVTGTSDKLYSAAEEAARNTDPGASFVQREADGGPASYKILGGTKTPALNTAALEAAAYEAGYDVAEALFPDWEADRNTVADVSKIPTPATGGPASWKQLNASRVGTVDLDAVKLAYEAARNTDMAADKVEDEYPYLSRGVSRVGTLSGGGGTPPGAPSWGGRPVAGNGQVTLPVVAAVAGDVIYARFKRFQALGGWSAESETFKSAGTGNIVVTGLTNETGYEFAIYSKAGGLTSALSAGPRYRTPTAGSAADIDRIMDAMVDELNALGLTDHEGTAIVATKEIPPEFTNVETPVLKVFPDTEEAEAARANRSDVTPRVSVAFCQRAKTSTHRTADFRLRERVRDYFLGRRLAALPEAVCVGETESGVLDLDALWQHFQWISVLTLEFSLMRRRG